MSRRTKSRVAGGTPPRRHSRPRKSPAAWLAESEALFREFVRLTPYRYTPFVKSFDSYQEYERWRRAQKNPWYR